MIVTTWDGDAMDAEGGRLTSAPDAYGKDVWSRRRDTGVKFLSSQKRIRGDGGNRGRLTGEIAS